MTLDPDGRHAYVAICGLLPPFSAPISQWNLYNNRRVAKIDLISGNQVAVGLAGDYPEEIALTTDSNGQTRHVYVTNGTAGTVTCFTGALGLVASIPLSPCFGSNYASVFPFGILASPDGNRVFAQGTSCSMLDVIDSDPQSPTWNSVISSIPVPFAFGRMAWIVPGQVLVMPYTEYLFNPVLGYADGSITGIATVDVSTGSVQHFPLVNFVQYSYQSITDLAVLPSGNVLVAVGFGFSPLVIEADPSNGAVIQQLDLTNQVGETLHGLALSRDGRRLAVTAINNNMEIALLQTQPLSVSAVLPTIASGITLPNEVAFSKDGSRLLVTLQGLEEVRVYQDLPDLDLELSVPSQATLGSPLALALKGVEWGQTVVVFGSLGGGPQNIGPHTIHLSNPFLSLFSAVADSLGESTLQTSAPIDPIWSGVVLHLQAGTTDRSGRIRLSGPSTVSFL
jgi:DNA-binding beta-propeller fold protein YncE